MPNLQLMRFKNFLFAVLFLLLSVSQLHSYEYPTLRFESTESFQSIYSRLERMNPDRFKGSMDIVGLTRAGNPIQIILASEKSEWGQQAPSWASGYALSRFGIIVLLPERVVAYPYESLENVLSHEVAHILAARASGNHFLPRWFDEGLAMVAAHSWDFEDMARLQWAIIIGNPVSLDDLNALFHQDAASAKKAYVLSHALVRFFIQEYGRKWPQSILRTISQGVSFEEAFARTTMTPLNRAEAVFWAQQTTWTTWVPAITSTLALWLGIVGLAFYAYRKQRQRAKSLQQQWKDEDDLDW